MYQIWHCTCCEEFSRSFPHLHYGGFKIFNICINKLWWKHIPCMTEVSGDYNKIWITAKMTQIMLCRHGVNLDLTCIRHLWYMGTVPNMNNIQLFMSDITNIHRAKVYFMWIKPRGWLITVPYMNKIHWFIPIYHYKYTIFMK